MERYASDKTIFQQVSKLQTTSGGQLHQVITLAMHVTLSAFYF